MQHSFFVPNHFEFEIALFSPDSCHFSGSNFAMNSSLIVLISERLLFSSLFQPSSSVHIPSKTRLGVDDRSFCKSMLALFSAANSTISVPGEVYDALCYQSIRTN